MSYWLFRHCVQEIGLCEDWNKIADAYNHETVFCWKFLFPPRMWSLWVQEFLHLVLQYLGPIFLQNLIDTVIPWKTCGPGKYRWFLCILKNFVLLLSMQSNRYLRILIMGTFDLWMPQWPLNICKWNTSVGTSTNWQKSSTGYAVFWGICCFT